MQGGVPCTLQDEVGQMSAMCSSA